MSLYLGDYYDSFRVMLVDPGLRSVGVSVWELATRKLEIMDITVETFFPDKILNRTGRDREYGTERSRTLAKIRNRIWDIAERHDVCALAHESPFFDRFRPSSFGPLSEACEAIRDGVLSNNPNSYIFSYPPQVVKKAVGAAGIKGKDIIREKIEQDEEIQHFLKYNYARLTEHCIDTMAIGRAFMAEISRQEGWDYEPRKRYLRG